LDDLGESLCTVSKHIHHGVFVTYLHSFTSNLLLGTELLQQMFVLMVTRLALKWPWRFGTWSK